MVRFLVHGEVWEPFRGLKNYDDRLEQAELLSCILYNVDRRCKWMIEGQRIAAFYELLAQELSHAGYVRSVELNSQNVVRRYRTLKIDTLAAVGNSENL